MKVIENQVEYRATNSYATLNTLSEDTRNVWWVFHGLGHLSKFFLSYFKDLPANENYIIAPQAPSKYYLNDQYRHVGASWLTKEQTENETANVMAYLDAVLATEKIPSHCKVIVFGYSQGVSIATRWVVHRQLKCHRLILYAGGLPKELKPEDFDFLDLHLTQVSTLVGDRDEYINPERLEKESRKIDWLFREKAKQIVFKGTHALKKELLHQFL